MFIIKQHKIDHLHNDNKHKKEVRKNMIFQLNILINLLVMHL